MVISVFFRNITLNVKNAFGLVLKSPVWGAQSDIAVNILEDATNFHSVDCCAVKTSYDAAKATLDAIRDSFKVK